MLLVESRLELPTAPAVPPVEKSRDPRSRKSPDAPAPTDHRPPSLCRQRRAERRGICQAVTPCCRLPKRPWGPAPPHPPRPPPPPWVPKGLRQPRARDPPDRAPRVARGLPETKAEFSDRLPP